MYGTLAVLVLAYMTRFLPQSYRGLSATMGQIHDDLENAARVAGATKLRTIRYIIVPILKLSIVQSALVLFILSLRELTASLFLYTTSTRVVAVVIYEKYANGSWSSVAAISLLFITALMLLTVAGRKWLSAPL